MNEEVMEQSILEATRLECLKLAVQGREGHAPRSIMAVAKEFLEFVQNGNG